MNSLYGIVSFEAMLNFARECKKYLNEVRVTVVNIIGVEEINRCRLLCNHHGLELVVREYIK